MQHLLCVYHRARVCCPPPPPAAERETRREGPGHGRVGLWLTRPASSKVLSSPHGNPGSRPASGQAWHRTRPVAPAPVQPHVAATAARKGTFCPAPSQQPRGPWEKPGCCAEQTPGGGKALKPPSRGCPREESHHHDHQPSRSIYSETPVPEARLHRTSSPAFLKATLRSWASMAPEWV